MFIVNLKMILNSKVWAKKVLVKLINKVCSHLVWILNSMNPNKVFNLKTRIDKV